MNSTRPTQNSQLAWWACRRCTIKKSMSFFRSNKGSLTGHKYVCEECEVEITWLKGIARFGPSYNPPLMVDFAYLSLDAMLPNGGSNLYELVPSPEMSPLDILIAKEDRE